MKNNPSTTTSSSSRPVLIVDKKGVLGKIIASELSQHFIVVLVSGSSFEPSENIVHIPFVKKIPKIPDNFYSYIFLIDDGENLQKSMSSFIKKANADKSRIILIESIRNLDEHSVDETRFYKNANVFFYGDMFSSRQTLSEVGEELASIKANKKMIIKGEGLEEFYPIHVDDFVESLIEQVFIKNNPSKIINLFPRAPITKLGLSRIVSSIDPGIVSDFQKSKIKKKPARIIDGDYPLGKYDLRSRIKDVLEEELPEKLNKDESLSEEVGEKNYIRVAAVFLFIFIVFFTLLPLITTLIYSGLGLYEIESLKKNLEKGDLDGAYNAAVQSNTFFEFASKTIVPLRTEARLIHRQDSVDKLSSQITLGQDVSQASSDLISGSKKLESIVKGQSKNPASDFDSSISLVKNAVASFKKIEAQSQDYPMLSGKISDVEPVVDLISNVSNILPEILGFDGEKKYLILFQNNMELRPGGGFIGSYAILKIKNAVVSDFKIYNVYDADGQLKGHIEPPFPISKYFGQSNYFLRDSNFSPEFLDNASEAAFILNLETGEKFDGIAAADLSFVKNLLSAIGPVDITDYNVVVGPSNLFQVTEEKAQKNSFAGSTQKQDFLSALFKSIQTRLGENKNVRYLSLAKAVSKSLSEKDILLASNDHSVQENLTVNGWSSGFPNQAISESNTFNDFLGINEANFGANKVNFFISRSISKAQMIDDQGQMSSVVTVNYKNDSTKDTYKNYLRFILPQGISVSQVSFDNVAQDIIPPETNPQIYESKNYKIPQGLEVDNYELDGKTIIGFFINIPPQTTKTISVTYSLNQSISLDSQFNYNFNYFKQPGVDSTPFDLSIYYPKSFSLVTGASGAKKSSDKITLNKEINADESFSFSFGQK